MGRECECLLLGGDGLSWKYLGRDINGGADLDHSGWSIPLSSDSKTVAIGSHMNDVNCDTSGHVKVFNIVHWVFIRFHGCIAKSMILILFICYDGLPVKLL